MRAVLQKVLQASVTVSDKVVGKIGPGVCVLIGISHEDTRDDLEYMAKKILSMRVFEDQSGAMWKKNVKDLGLQILCVSQFTLYGKTTKGSKPDFHEAMKSSESRQFFDDFVKRLDGEFGAMMQVALVNDGPVTLQLDSRKFSYEAAKPDQKLNAIAAAKEQRRQGFAGASSTSTASATPVDTVKETEN
ncbi:D-Tyr tRNAtyr deacylase-like domain-containing protein [Kickxella alabastrina]|uniref:D-Tyr tRNAtyr deacylase-like domain-containing protein n=1 Tax=Kickxella alabastrina TaxID=61397 RepID=UPI0022202645|nr:D-Tyr tRNAtyr deacylase-like domain-containing protein [Kickxella alabastrina]KAI7827870.1 D-Tyr tRNAtyr deacylase-like domain-containing protein [Kickxella alabastrina]